MQVSFLTPTTYFKCQKLAAEEGKTTDEWIEAQLKELCDQKDWYDRQVCFDL